MNQLQDDFSQYEVQPMVDDFQQYEVQPTEESTLSYLGRGATRVASRLGEMALGLPEDLRQLAGNIGINLAETLTGHEAPNTRKALASGQILSSSSDIRKELAERTGGYTEPQTPGEETADEFLTDVALLGLPVKGKIPFQRAIGTAIAGHLAKEGVAKFGGGETAQDLTKLGTYLVAGMVTPGKTAKTFSDSLFKKRDAVLPAGADVDTTVLNHRLNSLKKDLLKGTPTAAEKAVLAPVEQLIQKSIAGRIAVDELTTAKRQINGLINEVIAKEGVKPKDARQLFKRLGKDIEETIEIYGKHNNPEFLQLHKDANQAHAAFAESKKITQFIHNKVPGSGKLAASLLFEGYHLGPQAVVSTVGAAGLGYSAAKAAELVFRINKSPVLRKYYLGVVKNAAAGNAAATANNLKALNLKIEKEDPEMYEVLQSMK